MAKKIDAGWLAHVLSNLIGESPGATKITIPMSVAVDICFALDRLRKIQEDIEGKFQEI